MRVLLLDKEAFRVRRLRFSRDGDAPFDEYAAACREAIAAGDGPAMYLCEHSVQWECPGCGHVYAGAIGPEPVSGWDSPRWRVTGTPAAPTLEPSLGCARWRTGECPTGHWWLRDGELVAA